MANARLALRALRQAVSAALLTAKAAGEIQSEGQTFTGWPTSTKLSDIFAQPTPQALVSFWPLKGKNSTRSRAILISATSPVAGVTATLNTEKSTLTIGGSPIAGDVVHAFFGRPALDAAHLVATGESTAAIATAIAAAINAFASAATATASGSNVNLSGATFSVVNVGGSGLMLREVAKIERLVQATVWCNDPQDRVDIADVIAANVGTSVQPFLTADDGTAVRVEICDDGAMNDNAESAYSSFRQDLFFRIEYGLTQKVKITQVGGVQYTQTVDSAPSVTQFFGGQ